VLITPDLYWWANSTTVYQTTVILDKLIKAVNFKMREQPLKLLKKA